MAAKTKIKNTKVILSLVVIVLAGIVIYTAANFSSLFAPNGPLSIPGAKNYGVTCRRINNQAECEFNGCTWNVKRTGRSVCTGDECLIQFAVGTAYTPTPSPYPPTPTPYPFTPVPYTPFPTPTAYPFTPVPMPSSSPGI